MITASLSSATFARKSQTKIIQMLASATAPSQKPWEAGKLEMPNNPTTDKPYQGGNATHLISVAAMKGFEDPRWLTYKQAAEQGWQVRKGEKETQIEYCDFPALPRSTVSLSLGPSRALLRAY